MLPKWLTSSGTRQGKNSIPRSPDQVLYSCTNGPSYHGSSWPMAREPTSHPSATSKVTNSCTSSLMTLLTNRLTLHGAISYEAVCRFTGKSALQSTTRSGSLEIHITWHYGWWRK
jgi:hypothetical protein